jgi:hypothetical protein
MDDLALVQLVVYLLYCQYITHIMSSPRLVVGALIHLVCIYVSFFIYEYLSQLR